MENNSDFLSFLPPSYKGKYHISFLVNDSPWTIFTSELLDLIIELKIGKVVTEKNINFNNIFKKSISSPRLYTFVFSSREYSVFLGEAIKLSYCLSRIMNIEKISILIPNNKKTRKELPVDRFPNIFKSYFKGYSIGDNLLFKEVLNGLVSSELEKEGVFPYEFYHNLLDSTFSILESTENNDYFFKEYVPLKDQSATFIKTKKFIKIA